jgi:hypothetical protein
MQCSTLVSGRCAWWVRVREMVTVRVRVTEMVRVRVRVKVRVLPNR